MKNWTVRAVGIGVALLLLSWGDTPAHAEDDLESEMQRGKARQDRVLKSYARRKDERGMAVFAEQERQRAEREDSAVNDWLAGRALHFAKKKLLAHKYLLRAWTKKQLWRAGLRLGLLYMDDKRYNEALTYIRKVRAVQPNDETMLRMMVEANLKLERYADAIEPLLALERLAAKSDDIQAIQIWDALGTCYQQLKNPQEAARWIERIRSTPQGASDPRTTARLAECYLLAERWQEAHDLLLGLKSNPIWAPNPLLQRELIMAKFKLDDPEALERELKEYVQRVPEDLAMQELLLVLLTRKKDWDGALVIARYLRTQQTEREKRGIPADPVAAGPDPDGQVGPEAGLTRTEIHDNQILMLLLRKEDMPGALKQARSMRAQARDPERAAALDNDILMMMLRVKDFQAALAHAEGMHKVERDVQKRNALDELLRRLRAGEDPTKPPERKSEADNPFVALVKRCIHEDAATRRKALREYFDLNLPLVDPIIYQRFSPDIEPDAECRIWVLRILGRFDMVSMSEPEYAREVAKRLAVSLEDPVADVRRVGAEELGGLGVPAGLVYLLPHLYRVDLDKLPADRDGRKQVEREYNAVRQAIIALSGHNDLSVIDDPWIRLEKAKSNRAHWDAWLDSDGATPAKLAALEDLRALKMEGMEAQRAAWILRFCLDHCFRPSRWAVADAAYRLLRDVRQPDAEGPYGTLWGGFPVLADEALNEPARHKLEGELKAWWRAVAEQPTKGGRAGIGTEAGSTEPTNNSTGTPAPDPADPPAKDGKPGK